MSCLKIVWKEGKTAQVQIVITLELTVIFACGFLHHNPYNIAFNAIL